MPLRRANITPARWVALPMPAGAVPAETPGAVLYAENCAACHGEAPSVAKTRAAAGHALVSETFGAVDDACELASDGTVARLFGELNEEARKIARPFVL